MNRQPVRPLCPTADRHRDGRGDPITHEARSPFGISIGPGSYGTVLICHALRFFRNDPFGADVPVTYPFARVSPVGQAVGIPCINTASEVRPVYGLYGAELGANGGMFRNICVCCISATANDAFLAQ
jgi:hypothetical protein